MVTLDRRLIKPRSGNSYRRCPKGWSCGPKVNDHRVCLVLNREGEHMLFSNEGTPYTKGSLKPEWVSEIVEFFKNMEASGLEFKKKKWPWVLDGGLMGPAYGMDPHALIVHDIPVMVSKYRERLNCIKSHFKRWSMYLTDEGVRVLPDWEGSYNPIHWVAMQEYNKEADHPIYEGLVCKDPDGLYPMKTNKKPFFGWIKYRFDQLN